MNKAIGMVEYTTVSSGMQAADVIVKTASDEIIEASIVCPGKYIALIACECSVYYISHCGVVVTEGFILGA